ncbi:MAG: tetratricopeptide repeat protein [Algibacter sp.]
MALKIKLFIYFFFASIVVFSQNNISETDSIQSDGAVFMSYLDSGQMGEALKFSELILKKGEAQQSKILKARGNNLLGITFSVNKDQEKSIYYYKKSLELYKVLKDIGHIVELSNNIGVSYAETEDYKNSSKYYLEALSYAKNEEQKILPYLNIGYDLSEQGDYKKAVEYLNKALPLTIKNEKIDSENYIYERLFYCYFSLGNGDLANGYYDKAIKYAKANDLNLTLDLLKTKYLQLKKENNAQEAFKIVDSIFKYKDVLKEREALNVYKEVEGKLHIKDNDEKLQLIEKKQKVQSLLNITLLSLLSTLLLLGFLLFYKNKQLKSLLQNLNIANNTVKNSLLEKELLEQQLESIQDDIMTDIQDNFGSRLSGISKAYDTFLTLFKTEELCPTKFSDFKEKLEKSLKNLTEDLKDFIWVNKSKNNSLVITLNKLELYIYDLTGKNKDIHIDLETSLFKEEYKLPKYWNRQLFLILRETIENALKYSKPSYITVDFNINENNKLTIITADNGKNFKREDLLNSPYIFNVKRRAETMGNTIRFEPKNNETINRIVIEGTIPNV